MILAVPLLQLHKSADTLCPLWLLGFQLVLYTFTNFSDLSDFMKDSVKQVSSAQQPADLCGLPSLSVFFLYFRVFVGVLYSLFLSFRKFSLHIGQHNKIHTEYFIHAIPPLTLDSDSRKKFLIACLPPALMLLCPDVQWRCFRIVLAIYVKRSVKYICIHNKPCHDAGF